MLLKFTGKKYGLDFSVHIFKQLGIQIFLQLAWFNLCERNI